MSAIVGFRFARNTRALCGCFYACARKYCPRFVRNGAKKASRGLAVQKRADGKYQRTEDYEQSFFSQHQFPPYGPLSNGGRDAVFPHVIQTSWITRPYPDPKSTFKT